MFKKIVATVLVMIFALSVASCSVDKVDINGESSKNTVSQSETRIHNNFKDLLPKFKFDSEPVENYREAISYSFTAKCSRKSFDKYVEKVKDAGFDVNCVEANGYFAGYTADDYYAEITLVNEIISVFVKST